MHSTTLLYLWLGIIVLFMSSCEEPYEPSNLNYEEKIVVEGYIEAGDRPTPPYVLLTRTIPYTASLSPDLLEELFVRGADVRVSDGTQEVILTEVCLEDIPEEFEELLENFLGFSISQIGFNLCMYIDFSGTMLGEEGKSYQLSVLAEGKSLSATTSIPESVGLDSIYFRPLPNLYEGQYREGIAAIQDPADVENYYRYFTQTNSEPLYPGRGGSVAADVLFDGLDFEFPFTKGAPRDQEVEDPILFGLFEVGDTVTIKNTNIDAAHFEFWNTLEFNAFNQGPFSQSTKVAHNIEGEGGIGIWGGYNNRFYTRIVE